MSPIEAPLFRLLAARLGWLEQRQGLLASNIANADTPDYQPRDLRETDFARLLTRGANQAGQLQVARTDQGHLIGRPVARLSLDGHRQDAVFETAPDGNAVVLEEQMAKATQTALDFQLTTNLYRKYLGMVRLALGTQS